VTNELQHKLDLINRGRLFGKPEVGASEIVEAMFGPSTKLFAYGTLRPGEPNSHKLDDFAGDWIDATVKGSLRDDGWGATEGYPAITLDPEGANVSGVILVSSDLTDNWGVLDEFEGAEYCRVLTCAQRADDVVEVVNVYALRELEEKRHGKPEALQESPDAT
jgi:gamma-glutamylcyclotransferase (GGCT)/AIG2-like uncharacterized protein YtfP